MQASYGKKTSTGITWHIGEKLTRDQLEIAVEKHKKGVLVAGGSVMLDASHTKYEYYDDAPGCIMQHLTHDPLPNSAFRANPAIASWFDEMYRPTWADWMLRDMMMQANLIEE